MFPLVRPAPGKAADVLYGSGHATIVLDRDGRLVHCGTDVGSAVAALQRLLASGHRPPK